MTTDNGIQRVGQMGLAQFEPRDFTELEKLARMAASSRLFAVTSPESAIVIMLTGASLGVPPVVAMRSIHVVQGRAVLSSDLIHALVRRSGFCQSWHVSETTAERCTITTHRRGEPQPYTHTWTIAMARTADLAGKGTWRQYPAAMLRARCTAEIARIVYPDVLMAGVYCEGEIDDDAGEAAAPKPVEVEQRRPAIDATPAPLALPADNGPSPSQASATQHALTSAEHSAMLATVRGAKTRDELDREVADLAEDAGRGTTAQKDELRAAIVAARKALAPPAPPPDDEPTPPDAPKPRGRRSAKPADAAGDVAPAANDGAVDAPGARSTSGHPMATRAERRAHLATLRRPEDVRTSWRHRAAMPPAGYMEDCADRVCALTPGFGVEDALAYLAAAAPAKASHEPKTRAA